MLIGNSVKDVPYIFSKDDLKVPRIIAPQTNFGLPVVVNPNTDRQIQYYNFKDSYFIITHIISDLIIANPNVNANRDLVLVQMEDSKYSYNLNNLPMAHDFVFSGNAAFPYLLPLPKPYILEPAEYIYMRIFNNHPAGVNNVVNVFPIFVGYRIWKGRTLKLDIWDKIYENTRPRVYAPNQDENGVPIAGGIVALAANQTRRVQFQIDNRHFVARYFLTTLPVVPSNVSVQMKDSCYSMSDIYFSRSVLQRQVFSSGNTPFVLPVEYLMPMTTNVEIELTELNGVAVNVPIAIAGFDTLSMTGEIEY